MVFCSLMYNGCIMSYFIFDGKLNIGSLAEISGDEARHILLSRRMKTGEELSVQDSSQNRYICSVESVLKNSLTIKPVSLVSTPPEPNLKTILLQSLISEQALDFIFQKGTELGVSKIVLFEAEFSPKIHSLDKKLTRWNKICLEAAKQSDRVNTPSIEFIQNLSDALEYAENLDTSIFLDVQKNTYKLTELQVKKNGHFGIFVGPEGGFSDDEVKLLRSQEFIVPINLGPRILRAETAVIASLAIVQGLFGDLN